MIHEDLSSQEYKELKNHLKLANGSSEHDLIATWRCIKHMQSELDLPPQTPVRELVKLFNNFEEIQKFFNLQINNFSQLNELFCELIIVKAKLNLPEDSSVTDVLSRINPELVHSLDLEENSFLKRLLQLYLPIKTQNV